MTAAALPPVDDNTARRARVLAHPDLTARLTQPPINYKQPDQWTGYVPPLHWSGRLNDSPIRAALVAIAAEAWKREREQTKEDGAA